MNLLAVLTTVLLSGTALAADATNHTPTTQPLLGRTDLEAVAAARLQFAKQRQPVMAHGLFEDLRAVLLAPDPGLPASGGVAGPGPRTPEVLLARAKKAGVRVVLSFYSSAVPPDAWRGVHEGVLFVSEEWDTELRQKAFTGIGLSNATQVIFIEQWPPDAATAAFDNRSTHLLVTEFTEPAVREALRAGHAYVANDELCDPTGFTFGAVNNLGVFPMGDAAPLAGKTRVTALLPVPAKLRLLLNGVVVQETTGTNLTYEAKEAGAYRLEARLAVDGEERPWIYSNPVSLRAPGLADLRLPSMEIAPSVDVRKDFTYVDGPEDQVGKHRLDLYVPKEKTPAPVFFFIHGGAWKYGDRAQYLPLGNRYAQAGYLTVLPSYRLAPKHRFPAQIDDVAAAFAWTVQHVAEHGGDTNRIYVGGHSAGGHLAALLALDGRQLEKHGLSPKLIRGVLALSGVYNLTALGSESDVFGSDPAERRDASPLFHLQTGAPPFLVTYCQWDYFSLPAQAKELHAALRQAGLVSELVYVAGQNHISEMLNVTASDDPTATAALRFMR